MFPCSLIPRPPPLTPPCFILGQRLPVPLCTAGPRLAQTGLSYSMSRSFCISSQISSKSCLYADYVIGYYFFSRKLCCFENRLAAIFESKFVQNFVHSKPRSFRPALFFFLIHDCNVFVRLVLLVASYFLENLHVLSCLSNCKSFSLCFGSFFRTLTVNSVSDYSVKF